MDRTGFEFIKKDHTRLDAYFYNEWIETTGNGGWASSSLAGAHTRRYHGMLVSGLQASTERKILLSRLDETIRFDDQTLDLGCRVYRDAIYPEGDQYLTRFTKDLFPTWDYQAGNFILRKTLAGLSAAGGIIIRYEVIQAPGPFCLSLVPLAAGRDYHSLNRYNASVKQASTLTGNVWSYAPYEAETRFYIQTELALQYTPKPEWFYNVFYKAEKERGQEYLEDLFSPGELSVTLKPGDCLYLWVGERALVDQPMADLWKEEHERRLGLLRNLPATASVRALGLASDQFIIRSSEKLNSIIAGYHWFMDWGRDTMISLPGLCLVTGRFQEAKNILETFAGHVYRGIIPNRFADINGKPEYNTADATLWFFIACYRYYRASDDTDLLNPFWLNVFESILDFHLHGTLYNIHTDHDGLLYQGEPGIQLTWMDAKVGDWVVTPRTGKAVEINALWYNAHQIMALMFRDAQQNEKSAYYNLGAERIRSVFMDKFWIEDRGYLYDVIDGNQLDARFRPNQLMATSLPYPLLSPSQGLRMLGQVRDKLLTPRGLRTLAQDDPEYQPYYDGDQYHRDKAYHQGTVWSWLIGPYIDSLIRLEGEAGRREAKKVLENFLPHLAEAGIGTVSEIFDAEFPYYPKGCIAQAWGVGEILRVMIEYRLYE